MDWAAAGAGIRVEVTPGFEGYLSSTYPKALTSLKALCETSR